MMASARRRALILGVAQPGRADGRQQTTMQGFIQAGKRPLPADFFTDSRAESAPKRLKHSVEPVEIATSVVSQLISPVKPLIAEEIQLLGVSSPTPTLRIAAPQRTAEPTIAERRRNIRSMEKLNAIPLDDDDDDDDDEKRPTTPPPSYQHETVVAQPTPRQTNSNPPSDTKLKSLLATTANIPTMPGLMDRYGGLLKDAPKFQLPSHYIELNIKFRAFDSALSFLQRQNRPTLFSQLKTITEETCKKRFSKENLAQIVAVFHDAYLIELVPKASANAADDLLIRADFSKQVDSQTHQVSETSLKMRSQIFEANLRQIVYGYHQTFLERQNIRIPASSLRNWHPSFKLETVPQVMLALLPESVCVVPMTAVDALRKGCGLSSTAQVALEKVALKREAIEQQTQICAASSVEASSAIQTSLKGINPSLVAKIAEKEKLRAIERMQMDDYALGKREQQQRVLEQARLLLSMAQSKKVNALPWVEVVTMLKKMHGSLHEEEATKMLNDMITLLPDWLERKVLSTGILMVKLNPRLGFKDLQQRLFS